MASPRQLIVKLTDDTKSEEAPALIRSILGRPAVKKIEALFPDDEEAGLATIFTVVLNSATSAAEAAEALQQDPHVQYAHPPAGRKPYE